MSIAASGCRFWLDHVSLVVPDFSSAGAELEFQLGLGVTPTPADPRHHGRIFLDRAYLEVSDREPGNGWRLSPFWFLRFDDAERLRAHLEASGIEFSFGDYEARDGHWDDVAVRVGSVPLPILVRRTSPQDLARDWPPPLQHAHACGALTLEAVHVTVPDLHEAVEAYDRLLSCSPASDADSVSRGEVRFSLARGEILLAEGRHPGLAALVLGVDSLERARNLVAGLGRGDPAWVDPESSPGLAVGFTEVRARP